MKNTVPFTRNRLFNVLLSGVLLFAVGAASAADGDRYPARPVKVILPFPPDTVTDTVARLVTERLATRLGQPFIVENKPGGSGSIGATFVARAPADGYTLLFTDPDVDELKAAGLTAAPARFVKAPLVAECPISIECKYYTTLVLPGHEWKSTHHVVIGRVVGVHIKDEFIGADGKVDILKIRPLARLGYTDYTSVESMFSMELAEGRRDYLTWGLSGGR